LYKANSFMVWIKLTLLINAQVLLQKKWIGNNLRNRQKFSDFEPEKTMNIFFKNISTFQIKLKFWSTLLTEIFCEFFQLVQVLLVHRLLLRAQRSGNFNYYLDFLIEKKFFFVKNIFYYRLFCILFFGYIFKYENIVLNDT
jgi:hypothetical protein